MKHQSFTLPGTGPDYPIRSIATFDSAGKDKPIMVFCHGFKGFMNWGTFPLMAEYFAQLGFVFVRFNFSMNGTTADSPEEIADLRAFGTNTISAELDDLLILLSHLQKTAGGWGADPTKIYLMGHSRGGGIALLGATHFPGIKAVIGLAPMHDFAKRWSPEVVKEWERNGLMYVPNGRNGMQLPVYWSSAEDYFRNRSRLDIPARAALLDMPVLIVHGDQDETLPVEWAFELSSYNPRFKLEIIPGAGHTFGGKHPWPNGPFPAHLDEALARITAFLKEY